VHISAKLFVKFQTEKKLLDFIHKNGFKTLMPNTSANTPMLSKNSNFYCISVFDPKTCHWLWTMWTALACNDDLLTWTPIKLFCKATLAL